jgi:hypothetical protein
MGVHFVHCNPLAVTGVERPNQRPCMQFSVDCMWSDMKPRVRSSEELSQQFSFANPQVERPIDPFIYLGTDPVRVQIFRISSRGHNAQKSAS